MQISREGGLSLKVCSSFHFSHQYESSCFCIHAYKASSRPCPFPLQPKCVLNFCSSQVSRLSIVPLQSSVIPIEAPCPWDVRLSVHPDLPDDSLPFLKPLCSFQLFRRREHVHVERTLKAPVSPRRQI